MSEECSLTNEQIMYFLFSEKIQANVEFSSVIHKEVMVECNGKSFDETVNVLLLEAVARRRSNNENCYEETKTPPVKRLGVKSRRKAKGWTQDELAEEAGVSNSTINRMESKQKIDFRDAVVVKVSKALGCKPEALIL